MQGDEEVGFREIQPCPSGEACVQFRHVRDRDRLIRHSPHPLGDVFISFIPHNKGRNWRRLHFNRTCWLLFVGVPFDYCNTEDIVAAIAKWGRIISWEKEDALRGKILVKARVTELIDIPKSIRWSEGECFEEESWTSSVEVLLEEMLGGGPADEDPIPPPGVDPHPIPQHANDFPGFHPAPIHNEPTQQEDWDDWEEQEEQGHWAFPQANNPQAQPPQQQMELPVLQ